MEICLSDVTSSPPLVAGLSALAGRYDALLCDVWGVLIDGVVAFPAAAEALRRFRAGGGAVTLITNASRPSAEVGAQLAGFGLPRENYDDIVSAGELTLQEMFRRRGEACHHLGPVRDNGLFDEAGRRLGTPFRRVAVEEADYVVCTGLIDERRESPEDYDVRLAAMRAENLPMICANPDIVVSVGGELVWCAGALAQRYAAMGGAVIMFGKPHRAIYDAALARLAASRPNARVLAVGDGAHTDLAGAANAGLDCLFILDGVHRDALFPNGGALDSEALKALCETAQAKPVALARELLW
jgi:HAD superfamily hydrolase (TIGR01459 family)